MAKLRHCCAMSNSRAHAAAINKIQHSRLKQAAITSVPTDTNESQGMDPPRLFSSNVPLASVAEPCSELNRRQSWDLGGAEKLREHSYSRNTTQHHFILLLPTTYASSPTARALNRATGRHSSNTEPLIQRPFHRRFQPSMHFVLYKCFQCRRHLDHQ